MKNKKAILLPETLKIILAVIGISLILYLSVSLYGLFTTKTEIEQAKVSIETLYEGIHIVESGMEEELDFFLQSPNDWIIVAWPNKDSNGKKPSDCQEKYCICLCESSSDKEEYYNNCNNHGLCKDVSKEIKVTGKNPYISQREIREGTALEEGVFIVIEGLTSLKISLENKGAKDEKIVVKKG